MQSQFRVPQYHRMTQQEASGLVVVDALTAFVPGAIIGFFFGGWKGAIVGGFIGSAVIGAGANASFPAGYVQNQPEDFNFPTWVPG